MKQQRLSCSYGALTSALTREDKEGGDENAEDGLGMGENEEEEEIERGTVSFGEHAFQFEKFEQVRRRRIFSKASKPASS